MNNNAADKQEVNEKYGLDNSEKYLQDGTSASSVDEKHAEEDLKVHGGDTALANAPWKYKALALVTALMFPCKYILINCISFKTHCTHIN